MASLSRRPYPVARRANGTQAEPSPAAHTASVAWKSGLHGNQRLSREG